MNFLTVELDVSNEFSTLVHGDEVKSLVLRSRDEPNTYDMFDIKEIYYSLEQYRKFIYLLACRQNPVLSNKIEVECVVSKKDSKHTYLFNPIVKYLNTITYHDEKITPTDDFLKYSYEYSKKDVSLNSKPIPVMYEYFEYSKYDFYKKYSFLDPEFYIRQNLIFLAMFEFLYEELNVIKTHEFDIFEPLTKMHSIEIIDSIPFINRETMNSVQFPTFYKKMLKLVSKYEYERWHSHVVPNFMIDTVLEFCDAWKIEIHPIRFSIKNKEDTVFFMRFSDLYNYPFNNTLFDLTLINYMADNKTVTAPIYVENVDKFKQTLYERQELSLISEFFNINPGDIVNKNNTFYFSTIEMFVMISNICNH